MRLTDIQLAGLRAEASIHVPRQDVEAGSYLVGKIEGRRELARELLAEFRDRGPAVGVNGPDCVAAAQPGACRCAICTQERYVL